MNVLVISPGADTGGQGFRIKRAFDSCGGDDWQVYSMVRSDNYIKYPQDLKWDSDKLEELYDWADVVHHKTRLDFYPILDGTRKKPTIIHHQGTRLRDFSEEVKAEDRSIKAVPLVSTVDLLKCYPESWWLPAPYDIQSLDRYNIPNRKTEFRICQCPTNRRVKSTEVVLQAIDSISQDGHNRIVFDLVEGVEWKVALSRKGRCNLFIDQFELGYGNNAIEAWAMKKPVISGVSDPEIRENMINIWGELPFYEANEFNLKEKIMDMVDSPELQEEYALRGYNHVMKWHDESKAVEFLKYVWSEAGPSLGAKYFKMAGKR